MNVEPMTILAEQTHRYPDKNRPTTGIDTRVEHSFSSHARSGQGNHKETDSRSTGTACSDSSRTIVRPEAIRDPLLRTIDDIVITVARSSGGDIGHVGARYIRISILVRSSQIG